MGRDKDIDLGGGTFSRPGKKYKHLKPYATLYESNYRDVPKTLRKIAKDIESGKHGNVNEGALVLDANAESKFMVFGFGPQQTGVYSTMALLDLGHGELKGLMYEAKELKAALHVPPEPPKKDK